MAKILSPLLPDCGEGVLGEDAAVHSKYPKYRFYFSMLRELAKSTYVLFFGREVRPRRILRGPLSGWRISVSPSENLSYLVGTAEPHLERAIKQFVSPGDIVYDVGANIGYFSLTLAKRVRSEGRVAAFEPIAENVRLLRENVRNNHLANVAVFDVAASDRRGEATIRMTKSRSMASLVWHKADTSAAEFVVNTVAIDDLVEAGTLGPPTFVKIDVEGAEGLVVRGMRRTIAAARPVLFIECSDAGREETWQLLRGFSYRCESAITRESVEVFEAYRHADFLWLP